MNARSGDPFHGTWPMRHNSAVTTRFDEARGSRRADPEPPIFAADPPRAPVRIDIVVFKYELCDTENIRHISVRIPHAQVRKIGLTLKSGSTGEAVGNIYRYRSLAVIKVVADCNQTWYQYHQYWYFGRSVTGGFWSGREGRDREKPRAMLTPLSPPEAFKRACCSRNERPACMALAP